MKVEQILQSKGVDVYAIDQNDSIADAVSLLNDKNIGAVVVKGNGDDVVGILSERDVVRRLGAQGAAALSLPISDCMTPKPFTCGPEALVDDILSEMTSKRIRHMPVVQDGKMVGLVSIGDVVKRKIENVQQEAQALKEYISG